MCDKPFLIYSYHSLPLSIDTFYISNDISYFAEFSIASKLPQGDMKWLNGCQ